MGARTGTRRLSAWAAALALLAGIGFVAPAWAQSCTSNSAPTVDTTQISNGTWCGTQSACTAQTAPTETDASKPFAGVFTDADGDDLTYAAGIDDDSTGKMSAFSSFGVNTATSRLSVQAKAGAHLLDVTPALPSPFGTLVYLDATDPCGDTARVYGKFTTGWTDVDSVEIVSTPSGGLYDAGDKILVRVTFSGAVTVDTTNGTPRLKIDLDATSKYGKRWAGYESGSGTTALTFGYTVATADTSTDGIAVVKATLELNGGTIQLGSSAAGLLHRGLAHDTSHRVGRPVIDVVEITGNPSRDASGSGDFNVYDTYVVGDEIRIDVKFNEPVVVTGGGDVRLRLDLGTDDATPGNSRRMLTHPRMLNGGRTLRFSYAVTSSDLDPDGVWVQTDASNRVIFEPHDDQRVVSAATGVNADLTKSGLPTTGNPKKMVDGSASASGPRPTSATVDGKTATLTFDSVLDKSYANNFDLGFFFSLQGGYTHFYDHISINQHARAVSVSDSTLTLTFSRGARAGETVTLNYWYMDPMRPLRDTSGNFAPPIQDFPVTNVTGGATGPGPVRAWLDGSSLRIRFAGDLDVSSLPAGSAFLVRTKDPDGNGRAITGTGTARVTGSEVAVTLTATALRPNEEVVSASYAKPSANPLRGGGGGDVRSFDNFDIAPTYVAKPWPALTASFHGMPAAHDGIRLFDFELRFSEDFKGLSLSAFEAGALAVTNGRLIDAKRTVRGENRRITVRVRPDSDEAMTLTLAATDDCDAVDAICAADGRKLSAAVAATVAGPTPLTAEFHGLPDAHDGSRRFEFEIRFSEEFRGLMLSAFEAGALQVTNGRLIDAKRTVRGENRRITVRVRPDSDEAMTLTLAATDDCDAVDAICAADGRKLSAAVAATVAGPTPVQEPEPALPVLSVAAATADEGGALSFAVTLSEAATGSVTVDYATSDGTAVAGKDYESASGTLTFSAGETAKTVTVSARKDTATEDDETVTLTLSNASGATLGTGTATGTITDVPPPPLTAAFSGVPAEHDGGKRFGFDIVFSEEFKGLKLTAFKAGALTVTNGRLIDAKRTTRGENRRVTVRVRPDSNEDMTLTLAAAADCTAADAVCAADGRVLSNTVTATVRGPALLSVADTEATEGEDVNVVFNVSLSRTATGTVTVDYRTVDGTAKAGEDYTSTSGTLSFSAGETYKTVNVPLLDDAVDDDGETFRLVLSNPSGATFGERRATATIHNADPLPKAWLSRFGRTSAMHVVGILDSRFDSAAPTGDRLTLGGRAVDVAALRGQPAGDGPQVRPRSRMGEAIGTVQESRGQSKIAPDSATGHDNEDFTLTPSIPGAVGHAAPDTRGQSNLTRDLAMETRGQSNSTPYSALGPDNEHVTLTPSIPDGQEATLLEHALWQALTNPGSLNVDQRRFLSQSSFHLSLTNAFRWTGPETEPIETARPAPDHPGHWFLWGQGALTQFQGTDNGVDLTGDVLTGLVGMDYARDRWLAGVALAYHDGDGSYRAPASGTGGDLNSTLITVNPYLRYALTPRLSVWGTLGYGAGTLQLQPERDTGGWHGSMGRHQTRGQSNLTPDLANGHDNEEVTLTPPVPTPSVIKTDMSLGMGAVGLRGVVYASANTELALKSDALWVRTASKETDGLRGAVADTRRVRLLLSGQHQRALPNDALLSPNVEVGIRYDDGDAETGFGMELGGGLGYTDATLGLTVETRARTLIAHEDGGYREWGLGGSLSLDPGRLGRGLALRLDSGWGLADSNAEALWQRQTTAGIAPQHGPAAQARVNAEVGYGLDVPWTYGILTPYGGMEWAGPGRTLKLGWRFNLGQQLSLSLDGERAETGYERADHSLMLRTSLPW